MIRSQTARVAALLLLVFGVGVSSATASTINFTYTGGGGAFCSGCTTIGTGSFSFDDSPLAVGLSDLTAFSLVNDFGSGNTFFTYGLANLVSFNATLNAAQQVTALGLLTAFVAGVGPNSIPQALYVGSLAVNNSDTISCAPPTNCAIDALEITRGTVTTSTVSTTPPPVPEPASMLLLGTSLAGLAVRRYRRSRS